MPSHPGVTSAKATSLGAAQLTISHNKTGFVWDISQISISTVPPGPLNVTVLYNAFPLLTPTAMISGATADGPPSIQIGDHDTIYLNVTGATPSCAITVAYYYDELLEGSGS